MVNKKQKKQKEKKRDEARAEQKRGELERREGREATHKGKGSVTSDA